jgi:hypothetical protein
MEALELVEARREDRVDNKAKMAPHQVEIILVAVEVVEAIEEETKVELQAEILLAAEVQVALVMPTQ